MAVVAHSTAHLIGRKIPRLANEAGGLVIRASNARNKHVFPRRRFSQGQHIRVANATRNRLCNELSSVCSTPSSLGRFVSCTQRVDEHSTNYEENDHWKAIRGDHELDHGDTAFGIHGVGPDAELR